MLPTMEELVRKPESELAKIDIAQQSFALAMGLPGSDRLPSRHYEQSLDRWAKLARREVKTHYPLFDSYAKDFQHSKNCFRVITLITVLQRDLRIRYDPYLIDRDDFFTDSANVFIHGPIDSRRGTCSNLPVLIVAVGRRLEYPLKLVSTKEHLFARWESPQETFNIECTSLGFVSHPDSHYLSWPKPTTTQEARDFCFLRSKTPREELAYLCAARGHVLLDNLRFKEAAEAYAWAHELQPGCLLHRSSYSAAIDRWTRWLRLRWQGPTPKVHISCKTRRFPRLHIKDELDSFFLDWLTKWVDGHRYARPSHVVRAEYDQMLGELKREISFHTAI